jgi:hypothetical protein
MAMKVAKTTCDGAHLPLVVAAYVLDYANVKVERLSDVSFEVRAWERVPNKQAAVLNPKT